MRRIRTAGVGVALRGSLLVLLAIGLAGAFAGVAAAEETTGAELFQLCSQCHGAQGEGNFSLAAPDIGGLPEWYVQLQLEKFRDGRRAGHPDDTAGLRMRPMARSLRDDASVKAVAAYVASLPAVRPTPQLTGGDATRGQTYFAPCIACHGVHAEGSQPLGGPPLWHASDWYLLTQLQHFKAGVRGSNPADAQGQMMRAMSMTLPDEQAMKDVIAYVMSLTPPE